MTHDAGPPTAAEDLRRWLDDDAVPSQSDATGDDGTVARWSRRRVTVAVAIAVPWVIVLVAMLPGRAMPTRRADPATGATESATTRDRSGPAAAGPLAVGLVRDALTHTGATTATAVDVAAAEPPQSLADATWIVRVHAVVLHGDRRQWRSSSHEIWAVPVGSRGNVLVALDRPWRVRHGDPPTAEIRWQPADVDVHGVRSALRRAGLPAPGDLVIERHPEANGVLRATSRTPAGPTHVWLRSTPSLVVLGSDRAVAVRP